jgi:hypothetical protein
MCGPLHATKLAAVAPLLVQDVGKPSHSYMGMATFVNLQERQMYSCTALQFTFWSECIKGQVEVF